MGTNTTIALYYNRNTYKLTINVDGGILNGNTDTSVIIGKYEEKNEIGTPTKAGYDFTGWTLTGSGTLTETTYTYETGNATLKANWKIKTLQIEGEGFGNYSFSTGTINNEKDAYAYMTLNLKIPEAGYKINGEVLESFATPPSVIFTSDSGETVNIASAKRGQDGIEKSGIGTYITEEAGTLIIKGVSTVSISIDNTNELVPLEENMCLINFDANGGYFTGNPIFENKPYRIKQGSEVTIKKIRAYGISFRINFTRRQFSYDWI